jgi:hypothetical protein
MLRTCSRIIALTAMVAGPTAQAEQGTLTLTCTGTSAQVDLQDLKANLHNWKPMTKPEPVSGGLTVDFTTGEVAFAGLAPIKVTGVNDAVIKFGGLKRQGVGWFLSGTIDRVTGDVTVLLTKLIEGVPQRETRGYTLNCKPAQRMFWEEVVIWRETALDASEFFNTVAKPNYKEFAEKQDDFRLLWNAIISMNTVAEYVALEQHGYAQVSRNVLARSARQIRNKDLDDLKYCAETLKHARKVTSDKQGFTTVATSTGILANDKTTWATGSHDLVDVAQRAFSTLSALLYKA